MAEYSAPQSEPIEFDPIALAFATPRAPVQIKRFVEPAFPAYDAKGRWVSGVFGKRTTISGTPSTTVQVAVHEDDTTACALIFTDPMTYAGEGFAATFERNIYFIEGMYLDAVADVAGDVVEVWLQFADGP